MLNPLGLQLRTMRKDFDAVGDSVAPRIDSGSHAILIICCAAATEYRLNYDCDSPAGLFFVSDFEHCPTALAVNTTASERGGGATKAQHA